MKVYMDKLQAASTTDLYSKVNELSNDVDSDCKWIQDSYTSCFRLIKSGFFPVQQDITEQGIGKRTWSCLDTCFDFSAVQCVSGEQCSKASADAANSNRSLSDFGRQQSNRKMDYLFKTKDSDTEIGCGECALVGGVNTTKEIQDAHFKMPKVMRDMLVKIASRSPTDVHKLHVYGLFIAAETLTLYILDSPHGYVTRYDSFNPVTYLVTEAKICSELLAVLTIILSARIIMENARKMTDNDQTKPTLGQNTFHYIKGPASISAFKGQQSNRALYAARVTPQLIGTSVVSRGGVIQAVQNQVRMTDTENSKFLSVICIWLLRHWDEARRDHIKIDTTRGDKAEFAKELNRMKARLVARQLLPVGLVDPVEEVQLNVVDVGNRRGVVRHDMNYMVNATYPDIATFAELLAIPLY